MRMPRRHRVQAVGVAREEGLELDPVEVEAAVPQTRNGDGNSKNGSLR